MKPILLFLTALSSSLGSQIEPLIARTPSGSLRSALNSMASIVSLPSYRQVDDPPPYQRAEPNAIAQNGGQQNEDRRPPFEDEQNNLGKKEFLKKLQSIDHGIFVDESQRVIWVEIPQKYKKEVEHLIESHPIGLPNRNNGKYITLEFDKINHKIEAFFRKMPAAASSVSYAELYSNYEKSGSIPSFASLHLKQYPEVENILAMTRIAIYETAARNKEVKHWRRWRTKIRGKEVRKDDEKYMVPHPSLNFRSAFYEDDGPFYLINNFRRRSISPAESIL